MVANFMKDENMKNEQDILQQEWIDSIDSLYENEALSDADKVLHQAFLHFINNPNYASSIPAVNTGYINSIDSRSELPYPGDLEVEYKISSYIRWNAIATVLNANHDSTELGGHISSYASSAVLYDVGFNHFWQSSQNNPDNGDMVFFQGHISPGVYARTFVEGRFSQAHLMRFRQESSTDGLGLSSYPHPWLMPDYWQFPTVSMGLGPLMAISQAKFLKYLQGRGLAHDYNRKVWCFMGDGETSEPESLGNLHIASKDRLDNLIFVINCNLQRLDGLVHGNGKIIQDLEGVFLGAGWIVLKVIWSSAWNDLLKQDVGGHLKQLLLETNDGDYQNIGSKDASYLKQHFFSKHPEVEKLVAHLADPDLLDLARGGHDYVKVYNAYYQATNNQSGKPVVILVKTTKGYGMKGEGESQNVAHQQKKLSLKTLQHIRDKFKLPITDKELEISPLPFLSFEPNSKESQYLKECRKKLGGDFPIRQVSQEKLELLPLEKFVSVITNTKEMSTTMAFVRILSIIIKDPAIGKRVVPIIPDEARTFGMEGLFKQIGIWAISGQNYMSEDANHLMGYKESKDGQILQEGINEAGAMSTWIAAASSYAVNNLPMIPFYIYYSMFGFQRIGDLAWAAGDMRCRGFLLGATAGRTTLSGEGLQHEDGHSHIQAGLIPNCESYDPTFAYELAVIINHGIKEMYQELQDKFYYITLMNQSYQHYMMPDSKDIEDQIIKGGYLLSKIGLPANKLQVNILSCGVILIEAIKAAQMLWEDFGISSSIYSITSFNKLGRDIRDFNRDLLLASTTADKPYISKLLSNSTATLTVAVSDYVRAYAEQIREYVPTKYVVLGTDGFGRSDYRADLRRFFEVDSFHIAWACVKSLFEQGLVEESVVADAANRYEIVKNKKSPSYS